MAIESIFPDKASTSSSYEVGDMRNSIKSYLGEEWVLCDGRSLESSRYPEIVDSSPSILTNSYITNTISSTSSIDESSGSICYGNNMYVATWTTLDGETLEMAYTNDLSGTWTTVTLSDSYSILPKIYYNNGVWMIAASVGGDLTIYYTTDPTGTWTSKVIENIYVDYRVSEIIYQNGLWIIAGYDTQNYYPHIWYATNHAGTWTRNTVESAKRYLCDIHYHNGTYVSCGYDGSNYPYIWYTTDPTGTWTSNKLSSSKYYLKSICYYNNNWVSCGYDGSNYPYIWYTTDPTGTWTNNKLSSSDYVYLNNICCFNNSIYAIGYSTSLYPTIYSSNNVGGSWDKWTDQTNTAMLHSVYSDSKHFMMFCYGISSGYCPQVIYNESKITLPKLTNVTGINTFIKIKSINNGYNLPSGYRLLEYIESTGKSYIDTNFQPNQDTRVVLDAIVPKMSSGATYVLSMETYDSSLIYQIGVTSTSTVYRSGYGAAYVTAKETTPGTRVIFDKNKNICTIGGITVTNTETTFQCTSNLLLLAGVTTSNTQVICVGTIYSCKLYDNGTLIRDYIPVMNDSGVAGLWDLVEKKFYGSATSTAFIAGNILSYGIPEGYAPLDYISANGAQYIDTNYKPMSENIKVAMEFKTSQIGSSTSLFGSEGTAGSWFSMIPHAYDSTNKLHFYVGNSLDIATISVPINSKNVLECNANNGTLNITFNGTTYNAQYTGEICKTLNYYLLANNITGTANQMFNASVYSCKIYDNDILIRYYIPVMNDYGVAGLWDLVEKKFYGSATSTAFVAGNILV